MIVQRENRYAATHEIGTIVVIRTTTPGGSNLATDTTVIIDPTG